MLNAFLFKHIDNSALVVFRIIFGLLVFLESVGSIFTGWITRTLVEPKFTFSFIGFEWLQPLPGNWMYVYYLIMGLLGLLIMVGYKYRVSMISFTLLWCGVYFMQKSSYNNHYYLLILLSAIMCALPAHRYASIDVKLNPSLKQIAMPSWCKWVFVLQLLILYTYASIAKMYPDWLDLTLPTLLMEGKKNYPYIGEWLQNDYLPYLIAYGGILFDGLIIPLLLFKKTRKYAFFASIFFHLFNSIVFQVGVFPYLSLAFSLFFFDPEVVRNLFLKKKPAYTKAEIIVPNYRLLLLTVGGLYFVIQVLLPVRHHFIQDDVLWTEEGHRMSWRMMLRSKTGLTSYRVIDKKTGETFSINLNDYLTLKQTRLVSSKPDAIWQFSQHLKKDYKAKGRDVSVFVNSMVSVNRKPYRTLIDPNIDMGSVKWYWFKHNDWILPSK
ncbi:MAG: HTTM domain-containing protein [Bizionia sp.]|nr:HTTM domain-containing protein [Bizionia sp.]